MKEAQDLLRQKIIMERMFLNLLDQSNQELAFLDLAKEKVQTLKEKVYLVTQTKDLAEARAQLAEHQAAQDAERYEERLAAANMVAEQACLTGNRENQQLQLRLEVVNMDKLQFQLLKI